MTATVAAIRRGIQRTHRAVAARKRCGELAGRACYTASRPTDPPKTGNWGQGTRLDLRGEAGHFYAFELQGGPTELKL
jgi:hypothetical protein